MKPRLEGRLRKAFAGKTGQQCQENHTNDQRTHDLTFHKFFPSRPLLLSAYSARWMAASVSTWLGVREISGVRPRPRSTPVAVKRCAEAISMAAPSGSGA